MPPEGQLTPAEIEAITNWVKSLPASAAAPRKEMQVTDKDREHWAFRPLRVVEPPAVKNSQVHIRLIDSCWRSWKTQGLEFAKAGRTTHSDPPDELCLDRTAADAGRGRIICGNPQSAIQSPQSKMRSTVCSPAHTTANAGHGIGSMWPALPTWTPADRPDATARCQCRRRRLSLPRLRHSQHECR